MALSLFQDPFFFPSTRQLARVSDDMQQMARLGACDIQETESAHLFHIDAPGMARDGMSTPSRLRHVCLWLSNSLITTSPPC